MLFCDPELPVIISHPWRLSAGWRFPTACHISLLLSLECRFSAYIMPISKHSGSQNFRTVGGLAKWFQGLIELNNGAYDGKHTRSHSLYTHTAPAVGLRKCPLLQLIHVLTIMTSLRSVLLSKAEVLSLLRTGRKNYSTRTKSTC